MKRIDKITINVAEILAPVIGSRDVIVVLEKAISQAESQSVDLNFAKVEFVSRSAAHALLVMKEDLQRKFLKKRFINFVNTNDEVKEMFRIIAANRAVPRSEPDIKIEKTDIASLVKCAL